MAQTIFKRIKLMASVLACASVIAHQIEKIETAWKVSKYGVIFGQYFPVFGLKTDIYGESKSPYSRRMLENTDLK